MKQIIIDWISITLGILLALALLFVIFKLLIIYPLQVCIVGFLTMTLCVSVIINKVR